MTIKSLLLNQNTSQLAAGMNGSHKNFPKDTPSALLRSSSLSRNILLFLILFLALILRVWGLDKVPVSLFGDEVDVGYHAYSLSKTGKDYTGHFLPLHLKSLADYKSPLYAYSIIPTVSVFGISPLGVRLPAALFGVLGIYLLYLLIKQAFKNNSLALLTAFVLTISPWHIHYSRWGFEGTLMLALFTAGLYFFLRSLEQGKWLVFSSIFFALTPLSYHSAKVFLPLTLVILALLYGKNVVKIQKKYLIISLIAFLIITIPFVFSTFFGGGTDRFSSTSVFNSKTASSEIGFDRLQDARIRDSKALFGAKGSILDRLFHNRMIYFTSQIINNYLGAFSTEFLFISGDPQPTHNVIGHGEFYKLEAIFIILGLVFLFLKIENIKIRLLLILWILTAPLPSILTKDGSSHASRLLFLLPPLIILTTLGIYHSYYLISKKTRKIFVVVLSLVYFLSFIFYQHNYWVHFPWDSQRWWHSGFKEAIESVVSESHKYNKVIISAAEEPPMIFFLGWSQFPPAEFQKKYPLVQENLDHFGKVSVLGNFSFPPIGLDKNLYELGSILPENSLYLAPAKEIKLDLIREPERVPSDLILIKVIKHPSGEPAFYLLAKNENKKAN
ncbi:MAG: Uncharacterized protein G01um10147_67 [Microgenomates group bacterium Gr01-1014_7]|nr:MAG: Uncharacterized protein G01um10147_67 [Microgenomates group bacterium Gr01-1014_7]